MGSPLSKLVIGTLFIINPMIVLSAAVRRLGEMNDDSAIDEAGRRRLVQPIMEFSRGGGASHGVQLVQSVSGSNGIGPFRTSATVKKEQIVIDIIR